MIGLLGKGAIPRKGDHTNNDYRTRYIELFALTVSPLSHSINLSQKSNLVSRFQDCLLDIG